MKNALQLATLALVMSLGNHVMAHSEGAPADACPDMKPKHPVNLTDLDGAQSTAQTSSPYKLTVSSREHSDREHEVVVTLEGPVFQGFMLVAKSTQGNKLKGHFELVNGTQHIACGNDHEAVITHTLDFRNAAAQIKGANRKVSFHWQAGEHDKVDIKFVATVVKNRTVFWEGVISEMVKYDSAGGMLSATVLVVLMSVGVHL